MSHVLDRPAWYALDGSQREHSSGDSFARCYGPDIGPIAAARDDSAAALESLAALVAARGRLVLLQSDPAPALPRTKSDAFGSGVQMILDTLHDADRCGDIEQLTEDDVPAMVDLATRTRPGPFQSRTHLLGTFWGIKQDGKLAAMAGERMKPPGYAEVSGVCTEPEFRGRGYAAALTLHVANRILTRGETPILHAFADNVGAIRLYETLGFVIRSRFPVISLTPLG